MKRIVLLFITAVLLLAGAVWVAAEDVGREEQAPPLPEMMESAEDGETGGATSQSEVTSPLPETAEIAEEFKVCLEFSSRGTWSNCAKAGQSIIANIFADEDLLAKVTEERKEIIYGSGLEI